MLANESTIEQPIQEIQNQPSDLGSRGKSFNWWFLTWNNPPENWRSALESLKADYAIGQLEIGENETFHIQACLYYKRNRFGTAFKGIQCWIKGIPSKDSERVIHYCTKQESRDQGPIELGQKPQKGRPRDYDAALEACRQGRVLEISADVLIPHLQNLQKLSALLQPPKSFNELRGIWFYGAPGTGKSRTAHETWPDAYPKTQNKWWDNYQGQDVVILDDLDHGGVHLDHLLKVWTDHYQCFGEIKGGSVSLNYSKFVVTSNYQPEDLWKDENVVAAIRRRFTFRFFYSVEDDMLMNFIGRTI